MTVSLCGSGHPFNDYVLFTDAGEIANRVSLYLSGANSLQHVPVAEALIMCKGKG